MLRYIELLYLLLINLMARKLFKTLAFLILAMHTRFWVLVVFLSFYNT